MDHNNDTDEKEGEVKIRRTQEEFIEATMGAIVLMDESHAIWMDRIFGKALDAVVQRLAAVQKIVQAAADDPDWEKMPVHLRNVVWMALEAVNSTMAAYQLIRHGYWQESLVLVKHVVEVASLMLHICIEPEIGEQFAAGKWLITKSITPASKVISGIGPMYGHLNDHAHPEFRFLVGKSQLNRERADERLTYSIGGAMYPEKEFYFRHAIRDVLVLGTLLHSVAEFAFRHKVTTFEFWVIDGNTMEWKPSPAEEEHFRQLDRFGKIEDNVVPKDEYQGFDKFRKEHFRRHTLVNEFLDKFKGEAAEQKDTQTDMK